MRDAVVTPDGDRMRWVEIPGGDERGEQPPRVYVHGLGASAPAYFAAAACHPLLTGPRSLLVDLLGFGLSDRPTAFDYRLESHADALATALRAAGVTAAEVVAHSMGGSVAIHLAARHPELVSRLVLVDANLDPGTLPASPAAGSRGIATFTEEEFLAGGWREVRDAAGPTWWATMRLAGLEALHRSSVHLVRDSTPPLRTLLAALPIPRTFLHPAPDGPPADTPALRAAGVTVTAVPDCGHNVMLDNPQGFATAVAEALGAEVGVPD
ncbi:alpha/beta fold hydrolase [Streptomyces albidoflavus]|uniref:alpha/beta fold hydrolase n=1 Tax=Streptomyces albidoflavus TaxID=1886 RepID=UPI00101E7C26|nr:alpha/beta hydrolase [Streptomyces albidoflavus]RZD78437.1 alpha/beta hydrolase [Streptomyces albidoflavus]RZD96372.1 alpha/beta hydrolase [Streptomyces albidoflavus]